MIRTAAILLATGIVATAAHAEIAAYSNFAGLNEVSANFFMAPQSPERLGFVFEAQASGRISSIVVPLNLQNRPGQSASFEIYAVDASGIPTTLIASGSQAINDDAGVPGALLYNLIPDSPGESLQAGQAYALTMAIDGPDSTRAWNAALGNFQGLILNGNALGEWTTQTSSQFGGLPAAQIFVVPAPAAATLLALAAPILTRRRRA